MNFLFAALLLNWALLGYAREACHPKDNGNGHVVCVCNVTHCDDLPTIKKTAKGVVTVFDTSRSGDRFKETELKFGYKHSDHTTKSETITIDKSRKVQTIIGFGGSFTDSTGYLISQLPEQLQEHVIKDFFADTGLEYSLSRMTIGGSDFSTRAYTYDDGHDGDFNLDHFALQKEDHVYKIPYMKKARQVAAHPQKIFGSPWSAPAWMKTNNEINHGGWLKGTDVNKTQGPGNQYYKAYAKYFVKFLDAYKKEGADIWGMTIDNEPQSGKNPKYGFNSLGFTKEIQRDFIKMDLGPTLKAAGYGPDKLNVMIFDDQRFEIHQWAETIFGDKDAVGYTNGIAYHWYDNKPDNLVNLDKTHQINPAKFIVNTESSSGWDSTPGSWVNLERFCTDIITVLNHYVAGYVHWNMVLDMKGGPSWAQSVQNAPVLADPANKVYYKQPEYYGLGHISKFISPGSKRLEHKQTLNSDQVVTTVFERPDGGVVVVAVNTGDDTIEYNIHESDQQLSNTIRGHSVQSYIFYDVM